jgi:hypothetical protein
MKQRFPLKPLRGGMVCALALFAIGVQSSTQAQDYSDEQRHQSILFNGQVQVPAGKRYSLSFTTRSNFKNARIAGNVHAQGGTGNDIRVLVTKGQSLVFDSGPRRSVVLSVDFSEPGQYVLMFDNSFSLISAKIVTGTISLVHWGTDVEQNEADQEEAVGHYNLATTVIQRLYAALRADERVWGTTQIFATPSIRLSNDDSINAAANWTTNSIQVNKGLFRLTDRAGDQGEDVLASALSHEMSHIFYRHPGYGSVTQGAKGLFDELRGVTALDRVQEKEADILGIRVACQAGFDPQGMLVLTRVFAQLDSRANSFMMNHPSGIERYNYLQGEAEKCRLLQSQQQQNMAPTSEATTEDGKEETTATAALEEEGRRVVARVEAARARIIQRSVVPSGQTWKLVQNPNRIWKFKVGDGYLYAEEILSDERRSFGDFDTVDVKRQGDTFIGTERERITVKTPDTSPQRLPYKSCQWDFAVELTSVTADRIEGRWEKTPKFDPQTCSRSGGRSWDVATWIRE